MILTSKSAAGNTPRAKRFDVTCDIRKGFTMRVYPTGSVAYKYRYRDGRLIKEIQLPSDFDDAASTYEALVATVERRSAIVNVKAAGAKPDVLFIEGDFDSLSKRWLNEHVRKRLAPTTVKNYSSYVREIQESVGTRLNNDVTTQVARSYIRTVLQDKAVQTPVQSNRMMTALASMFKFGLEMDIVTATPVYGLRRETESPKSRMLTDDELTRFLPHLSQCQIKPDKVDALKLIFLTGMRSGEVCGLTVDDLDLNNARIELPRTKNGLPFVIALPQLAVELLRGRVRSLEGRKRLFNSTTWGLHQASVRACESVQCTPCSPHDFRRGCATMCGQEGVAVDTISRILNHSAVGVTRRHYALYDMEKEKRAALEMVAAKLTRLGLRI